jgi:GH25 family lysozyme M1 (1,4-beta-N-acetylmuramidase)
MKGIDVSKHQGVIDWKKVKADDIDFAMIRASFGRNGDGFKNNGIDDMFEDNYKNAKAAGVKVGAYHYCYADTLAEAHKEADNFLTRLKGKTFDYPVALDLEDGETTGKLSDKEITDIAIAFLEDVKKAGYDVMIYCNKYWFTSKVEDSRLKNYPHWLAEWKDKPTYSGKFDMWQYTSDGRVSGIKGRVDMNEGYKDYGKKPAPKSDSKVKQLQCFLNMLNIRDDNGKALAEDGSYGPKTTQAVRKFQKITGIKVDGNAGPQTMGVINQILCRPVTQEGAEGAVARYIQFRVGCKIDGSFGPQTDSAVKRWQKNNGLVSDGSVGPKTWAKLL